MEQGAGSIKMREKAQRLFPLTFSTIAVALCTWFVSL